MNMNTMFIIIIFYISHLLMIITIPILVFSAAADDTIENHNVSVICSSTPGNSTYNQSVKAILSVLLSRAPKESGFWTTYWGKDPADWAYGLALCYGSVTSEGCNTCLTNATNVATNNCPNNRAAIIWLDDCLLKYSDESFFGQIDTGHKFYSFDKKYSPLPWSYTDTNITLDLLYKLVVNATTDDQTGSLYAFNSFPLRHGKVDAVVQCTRDLSVGNCSACLKGIIADIRSSDTLKSGGELFSGSCYVRYHMLHNS